MTDVYSIVLSDEIFSKPPVELAQGWVNHLLLQLELDGFDGYKKDGGGLAGTGTMSKINNAQLLGISFPHIKCIPSDTELL
jgi:hypothetical protein